MINIGAIKRHEGNNSLPPSGSALAPGPIVLLTSHRLLQSGSVGCDRAGHVCRLSGPIAELPLAPWPARVGLIRPRRDGGELARPHQANRAYIIAGNRHAARR